MFPKRSRRILGRHLELDFEEVEWVHAQCRDDTCTEASRCMILESFGLWSRDGDRQRSYESSGWEEAGRLGRSAHARAQSRCTEFKMSVDERRESEMHFRRLLQKSRGCYIFDSGSLLASYSLLQSFMIHSNSFLFMAAHFLNPCKSRRRVRLLYVVPGLPGLKITLSEPDIIRGRTSTPHNLGLTSISDHAHGQKQWLSAHYSTGSRVGLKLKPSVTLFFLGVDKTNRGRCFFSGALTFLNHLALKFDNYNSL